MNTRVTLPVKFRHACYVLALCLSAASISVCAATEETAMNSTEQRAEGARDFDFIVGHWHVVNHRLVGRLQGSTKWETFEADQVAYPLPGGIGDYDDFQPINWRPGFVGMSLRIFSPETRLWSIFWIDNKTGGLDQAGTLLAPVVGKFIDGVGIFEGDDTLDGKVVRVRYKWFDITPNSAKWEQSMSADGGKTWEVNWTSEHTRVAGLGTSK
ncbi:hypothetical protein LT85_2030 [Collimonas arenae]|uniref:DUF1579 domain-containing protein n=1 Tax=Collimonas arenae TaxID=279058 RepID=A0A0A1F8X0_9BURK|nr:hypothetical protein [Collimonas arenae]AIY41188.1 hypothetical protein LT85_2030 [Collimonas arenae]